MNIQGRIAANYMGDIRAQTNGIFSLGDSIVYATYQRINGTWNAYQSVFIKYISNCINSNNETRPKSKFFNYLIYAGYPL